MKRIFVGFASVLALTSAAPILAKELAVAPGPGAQERLQEALILAQPGDVVMLGEGRFDLTDGLSLDVAGVTLKGAGPEKSVLSFKGQLAAGEGLLVTSDHVVLRDFAVEDSKGDAIKSKGADNIVYSGIRVEWTGGPKATNGAYGIYPVESTGVLVTNSIVKGASDAGIYVGQSRDITVSENIVSYNVAGIEIENSNHADVFGNTATRNTGGILVFDLPNLPRMGGGGVRVYGNKVFLNDTPNFAPKGNIVAGVPNGTGVIIMANRDVHVFNNILGENGSTNIFIVGYRNSFTDTGYNPLPANVVIGGNTHGRAGYAPGPQFEGGAEMLAAMGSVPPIVWDGTGSNIRVTDKVPTLSLGLTDPKARATSANPAVVDLSQGAEPALLAPIVLPQSMEAAIR